MIKPVVQEHTAVSRSLPMAELMTNIFNFPLWLVTRGARVVQSDIFLGMKCQLHQCPWHYSSKLQVPLSLFCFICMFHAGYGWTPTVFLVLDGSSFFSAAGPRPQHSLSLVTASTSWPYVPFFPMTAEGCFTNRRKLTGGLAGPMWQWEPPHEPRSAQGKQDPAGSISLI